MKFHISRVDGEPIDPQAQYVILRVDDPSKKDHLAARAALETYVHEAEGVDPEAARDVQRILDHPVRTPEDMDDEGINWSNVKWRALVEGEEIEKGDLHYLNLPDRWEEVPENMVGFSIGAYDPTNHRGRIRRILD